MKVRVSVETIIDCEIDDKFRELAVPTGTWAEGNIPVDTIWDCVAAVEEATHIPFWDKLTYEEAIRAEHTTGVITSVQSAENGETMLEA